MACQALVLELVDGETLADRIARGPIPLNEALTMARQMADALEAAHEKGIVHRDLKPANIKITPDGVVKVLDFGLAKAASGDAATADLTQSPTLTVGGTREGVILGTAAYMSPEQARGRPADKRADVWAFGVVLYEMLTGRRAFEGETTSDVLAKVIEREPDWTALPASTPPRLRELLRRCGRKDPKTRLQAIGDARIQIEELISGATEETATAVATQPRAQRSARFAWIVAALSLVIAAALAVPATLYFRRVVPEPLPTRFEIPTPPTSDPVSFALSADGRQLAFVATAEGTPRLWVRPLDQVTAQPLAGTEGASYPFWAPDGRAIGFFADGKLKRIDLGSGGLQVLADAPSGRGGTWNRDDVLVFAPDVARGPDARDGHGWDAGGRDAACVRPGEPSLAAVSARWAPFPLFRWVRTARRRRACTSGRSTAASRRACSRQRRRPCMRRPARCCGCDEGVLVAQRFDPAREVVSGEPIPVAQAVGLDDGVLRGAFAVSATGVLAHRAGRGERRQLTWVDRAGIARGTVGPPDEDGLSSPELAPDGQRVAVHRTVQGNHGRVADRHWPGRASSRFTFDAEHRQAILCGLRMGAAWCLHPGPNGRCDLFEKAASGAGDEQPLLVTGELKTPLAWSPDGQVLLYAIQHPKTGLDLWALPLAGDRKPFPVVQTPFDETAGQFSPDGRWVAYQSNESRTVQIYVRPFPGPAASGRCRRRAGASRGGGPTGRNCFMSRLDARLMAVPIAVGADRQTLEPGAPVPLFRTRLASGANILRADVEAAVRGRLRRALSDERGRRGGDRATHHGRPQLGRGVEEVTIPLLAAPASATPSPASSRA